ncbi:HNH endonuclease [Alphaproteobacteria bacterium LSUCC0719]
MARWNDLPWREEVYAAADVWKERCLLNDGALFSDAKIWTLENIQALYQRLQFLQKQEGKFWEKLIIQMKDASADSIQLQAELLWFVRLFPIGKQMDQTDPHSKILVSTKRKDIARILSWGRLPMPESPLLSEGVLLGIGKPGPAYLQKLPYMQLFLTKFLQSWKSLSDEEKLHLLEPESAFEFASHCDNFLENDLYNSGDVLPLRHALVFLLFPDSFERMVSTKHKKEIVRDYWNKLSVQQRDMFFDLGGVGSPLALDKAILVIRRELVQQHRTNELDFYRGILDLTWGMVNKPYPSKEMAVNEIHVAKSQRDMHSDGEAERFENLEAREDADEKLSEGEKTLLSHYRRERRPQLRETKLRAVEKRYGVLRCECCGTEAESYPSEYRKSIFEVHHKRPLAEGPSLTGMDDLALLCANCHRAIHVDAELPEVDAFSRKIGKLTESP